MPQLSDKKRLEKDLEDALMLQQSIDILFDTSLSDSYDPFYLLAEDTRDQSSCCASSASSAASSASLGSLSSSESVPDSDSDSESASDRSDRFVFALDAVPCVADSRRNSASVSESLLLCYAAVVDSRYLQSRDPLPRSTDWFDRVFFALPPHRFRAYVRMDANALDFVVHCVEGHATFRNRSIHAQAPVRKQVVLALVKLGSYGNRGTNPMIAAQFGVSDGHVHDCTTRVIEALYAIRDDWIRWPDAAARRAEAAKNEDREGFEGVVGKIDGSDIPLDAKPGGKFDPANFFNRKKRYALDLCAVCDSSLRFTYSLVGWPNSVGDAKVWASTGIAQNPQRCFSAGEYLLADKAYPVTEHLMAPYKRPLADIREYARFNYYLSNLRVDIEHAFGVLKSRWPSLKGLRIRIQDDASYVYAVKWIQACVVLHNMMISLRDSWEVQYDREEQDEDDEEELNAAAWHTVASGNHKRDLMRALVMAKKQLL